MSKLPDTLTIRDVHLGNQTIPLHPAGTLICDIDGTVADLEHRRVYVTTKPSNWAAFEKLIPEDTPIVHVIEAVQTLRAAGWNVIMCSGRGSQSRVVTEKWLKDNGVEYDHMYMRAHKDYRRDDIIKSELLDQIIADGFIPTRVFDDRNQVVEMWRARGIHCVQVAEGDF